MSEIAQFSREKVRDQEHLALLKEAGLCPDCAAWMLKAVRESKGQGFNTQKCSSTALLVTAYLCGAGELHVEQWKKAGTLCSMDDRKCPYYAPREEG
jgi:hypothetical protein